MKVYRPLEERNTPVRDCLFALLLIVVYIAGAACAHAMNGLERATRFLTKKKKD